MKSITACVPLLLTCALAANPDEMLHDVDGVLLDARAAFVGWVDAHGKEYKDDAAEFEYRFSLFEQNANHVKEHNAAGLSTTLRLNQFADLSFEEFKAQHLGYSPELQSSRNSARLATFRHGDIEAADAIDWTEKGAVTGVKNQGQCGSCWAFSTTGSIEGINFLETGHLVALSEQELVDCDKGDLACSGGLMDNAFHYIVKNGGLDSEDDYPYWGAFPSLCNHRKQTDRHVVDITGFEDVPAEDEDALQRAVSQQPVSVAICVDTALQFYSHGIFDGDCCTGLNHGVLLVGYGTDGVSGSGENGDFWKVKNSWGEGWGEKGYFRLQRGRGGPGQCGIALKASYPVKSNHDDPKVPTICDAQLFSLFECATGEVCHCDFDVFGLLCLWYSCKDSA